MPRSATRRLLPLLLVLAAAGHAAERVPVASAKELAAVPAGAVAELAAGTVRGPLAVPAGVTLRGAGMGRTRVECDEREAVTLAAGSAVEDLAIAGKGRAIVAVDAAGVAVRRVLVRGGTAAVTLRGVDGARVENVVSSGAMLGVALGATARAAVVNCTFVECNAAGISIADATGVAVFNTIVAEAGTAVIVGGTNRDLAIDHNLYLATVVGKIGDQLVRPTIPAWRSVSGFDARSVQLPVAFARPAAEDFHPVGDLPWAPGRSVVADWGVAGLGGHAAPAADADGRARIGPPDVGAYEAPGPAARGDGAIAAHGDGLVSAGVFAPDGRLVDYLFQGLPLKAGAHAFVLPARDQFGRRLAPGRYEVRVVEAGVDWAWRGFALNAGGSPNADRSDWNHAQQVRAMPDGRILIAGGWSERHINVQLADAVGGEALWSFRGTQDPQGMCLAGDEVLFLRRAGDASELVALDVATGRPRPRADGAPVARIEGAFAGRVAGIAVLGDRLYAADPAGDRIVAAARADLAFAPLAAVPRPADLQADDARGLLWLISDASRIVALRADGGVALESTAVAEPIALAVQGNRLAVASAATGKVHLLDCSEFPALRQTGAIGLGDGPFGPWRPDRFHFQRHALQPAPAASLALAADGTLTVRDHTARLVVFGPDGAVRRSGAADWAGDAFVTAFGAEGKTLCMNTTGAVSFALDARAGTWAPAAYWGLPSVPGLPRRSPRGFFTADGARYGLFAYDDPGKKAKPCWALLRYEDGIAKPAIAYRAGEGGMVWRVPADGDAAFADPAGEWRPLVDQRGERFTLPLVERFTEVRPDGWVLPTAAALDGGRQRAGVAWRFLGFDAQGVPRHERAPRWLERAERPSPYDPARDDGVGALTQATTLPDGGLCAAVILKSAPRGMGMSNSGATDLACWGADGALRWLRLMNDYNPVQGVQAFPDAIVTSWGHQAEFLALDHDGLELGRFGFPAAAEWNGMWVDHPQQWQAGVGGDGRIQVLVGDYMSTGFHWFTIDGLDRVRRAAVAVTVDDARARALDFAAPPPRQGIASARTPPLRVARLKGPMTIDGDPAKWRSIPPQVLLTPQSGTSTLRGPADCSAVLRLAYDKQDLYVQAVVFDDAVHFHQPLERFFLQDSLQFTINGFLEGFAFNLAETTDLGPVVYRNRFFHKDKALALAAGHAPRAVRRFADSAKLPERALIESLYGVDLARSPAYVLECRLPLDETSYAGDAGIVPRLGPGRSFWFGAMLNDNDVPGTDVQKFIVWPGTWNMFAPTDAGAKAVCE